MKQATALLASCALVSIAAWPGFTVDARAAIRPALPLVDAAWSALGALERKVVALATAVESWQAASDERLSGLERRVAAMEAGTAAAAVPRASGFGVQPANFMATVQPVHPLGPLSGPMAMLPVAGPPVVPELMTRVVGYEQRFEAVEHRMQRYEDKLHALEGRIPRRVDRAAPERGDRLASGAQLAELPGVATAFGTADPRPAGGPLAGTPMEGYWLRAAQDGIAFVSRNGAAFSDPPIELRAKARHPEFGRVEAVYQHEGAWYVKTQRGWLKSEG